MYKLYNKIISTQRLSAVEGSLRESFQENLTGIRCTIHPVADGEFAQLTQGAFYQVFKMWCPESSDVLIGDKVVDGETIYTVKSVSTHNFGRGRSNEHKMCGLILGK